MGDSKPPVKSLESVIFMLPSLLHSRNDTKSAIRPSVLALSQKKSIESTYLCMCISSSNEPLTISLKFLSNLLELTEKERKRWILMLMIKKNLFFYVFKGRGLEVHSSGCSATAILIMYFLFQFDIMF